jgi:hypothetical protein
MSRGTRQIFHFNCPNCGSVNTSKCKKCGEVYRFDPTRRPGERLVVRHLTFGEDRWKRVTARAKILNITAAELVRLSLADTLASPPERLIS